MNRKGFQQLARIRQKEAKALLESSCFSGAYYLSGYVLECAIKACIAKKTKLHDFPDKKLATDSYTHKLTDLIRVAGLQQSLQQEMDRSPDFKLDWNTAKEWNEESRYQEYSEQQAKDIYQAISKRKTGLFRWIRKHW